MATTWEQLQTVAATGTPLTVVVPGGHHCRLRVVPAPSVQGLNLFAGTTRLGLLPPPASSGVLDYSGLLAEEATAFWYNRHNRHADPLDCCGRAGAWGFCTLAGRPAQACACACRPRQGGEEG